MKGGGLICPKTRKCAYRGIRDVQVRKSIDHHTISPGSDFRVRVQEAKERGTNLNRTRGEFVQVWADGNGALFYIFDFAAMKR